MRKIQTAISSDLCIRLTWNLTGSCGQQQGLREWSRMVVKQFQDGGRPPFWKSIYRYISVKNHPIFMTWSKKWKSCIGQTPSSTERISCSKTTTLLPLAKCTRPLFQGRTGCGGRPSAWHDIVTCQRLVCEVMCMQYFENEWADSNANWHEVSAAGYATINLWNQEIEGLGHRRPKFRCGCLAGR